MKSLHVILLLVAPLAVGCKLLNTEDSENVPGRGPRAFDPYLATRSGAIKLSLIMVNNCAVLPTGEAASKGSARIPYPDTCPPEPIYQKGTPNYREPLLILNDTTYFLNHLILSDMVYNLHSSPGDLPNVAAWFKSRPRFGKLNWDGLTVMNDELITTPGAPTPTSWTRRVRFHDAAWQHNRDDHFDVEVLDPSGNVLATQQYAREDFLVDNPFHLHSVLLWDVYNIKTPTSPFPRDHDFTPADQAPLNFPPTDPFLTRTIFKLEVKNSLSPFKQFHIPAGLAGDGAIRVTWSQLPNDPFYFPVRYISSGDLAPTCFTADTGQPTPCSFGLEATATFSKPANGKFYVGGERIQVTLASKDALGNLLNSPSMFPSYEDFLQNRANGLLYFHLYPLEVIDDDDVAHSFQLSGPRQLMKPFSTVGKAPYYSYGSVHHFPGGGHEGQAMLSTIHAYYNNFPGIRARPIPATQSIALPDKLDPGTYVFAYKTHRYFLGERTTHTTVYNLPVGQEEPTPYPGEVGNCQICHRGTASMENTRHGMNVDNVEGCKMCHDINNYVARHSTFLHGPHMFSDKYPMPKNDCSVCHLTKRSALRASYLVCQTCHPSPHGSNFFPIASTSTHDPTQVVNGYSTCAQTCHEVTPPKSHILPPN